MDLTQFYRFEVLGDSPSPWSSGVNSVYQPLVVGKDCEQAKMCVSKENGPEELPEDQPGEVNLQTRQEMAVALKPSIRKTLFGDYYWNNRRVIPPLVELDVLEQATNEPDADDEMEYLEENRYLVTEHLMGKEIRGYWKDGIDMKFAEEGQTLEGVDQDKRYEVSYMKQRVEKNECVKRVRANFMQRYESRLLRRVREKFIWDQTPRNKTNEACVHHYIVQLMSEDRVRAFDRGKILENGIVNKYFVPKRCDVYSADYKNSRTLFEINKKVTGTRVDHGWQRFFGLGIRTQAEGPSANC